MDHKSIDIFHTKTVCYFHTTIEIELLYCRVDQRASGSIFSMSFTSLKEEEEKEEEKIKLATASRSA